MNRRIAALTAVAVLAVAVPSAAQDPTHPANQPPAAAEPTNVTDPAPEPPLPGPEPPIAPTRSLPVAGKTIPIPLPRTRGGDPLYWDAAWRRSNELDYTIIGAGAITTLITAIIKPFSAARPWRGGILFDEPARQLRLDSFDQRATARDASDVTLALGITYPFLIDAMVTAWWYRGNKQVAKEMAIIDLETLAVTAAIHGFVASVGSRERPYGRTCGAGLPADSLDCESFSRYRSYFSGHSALSFTSAALVCTHHAHLGLFANNLADGLSCLTAFLAAGTTATLRVVGDVHYASDVISGAILGTSIGFGVPWLLHYRRGSGTSDAAKVPGAIRVQLVPSTNGAAAVGTW